MVKTIVVSDTNIFIDLVRLNILDSFFALPFEVHTTNFVINELTVPEQKTVVADFIKQNKLIIGTLSSEEVGKIALLSINTGGKISITDFSVCLYSKKNGYTLLTGDKKLRKVALDESITVRGILYLFDEMVNNSTLTLEQAIATLRQLKSINPRIPSDEVDTRISNWESKIANQKSTDDNG
ncbi:MAG: hypothetical protein IJ161_01610 [Bacteroidales bacterium]|nr:hypothetical protein [Bacteroidales bacterium]